MSLINIGTHRQREVEVHQARTGAGICYGLRPEYATAAGLGPLPGYAFGDELGCIDAHELLPGGATITTDYTYVRFVHSAPQMRGAS
ncbi:MAG: hypothetical protein Q7J47_03220 [Azoarcus sp.]|nr:hypothetical protein [Azoarcus sp.]